MAEDNPEYRFDMFKMYIDTAIKVRGSSLEQMHPDADTQMVLDGLSPKLYMVMIFKVIFRIRAPENINRLMTLKLKKEYEKIIGYYARNREYSKVALGSYQIGLVRLLELLDLHSTSDLKAVCTVLTDICDSIETGYSDYHDELFEVVRKCADHMIELYDKNDTIEKNQNDETVQITTVATQSDEDDQI